jgi:hypothetical protein
LNLYHNILNSSKKSEFLLKEFKCLLSTEKNNFQEIFNYISGEHVQKSKICDSIIGEFLNLKLNDLLSVIKSRMVTHEVNWGILILFIRKIDQHEQFMSLISELARNSIQNETKNDLIVNSIFSNIFRFLSFWQDFAVEMFHSQINMKIG